MSLRRAVVAVALLLLLGACTGGADGGDEGDDGEGATTTTERSTAAALVAEVDETRLRSTLGALAGQRVTAEERAKARRLLTERLEAAGVSVAEEAFGDGGVNVIGTIGGRDPGRTPVLLSAHYDTVPGSPGADDNGSGVVAVLEAARVLAGAGLDAPIEIALFDLEELGLLGSRHHATVTSPAQSGFNLDMVGYTCRTPGCQVVFPDIAGCLDGEGSRGVGDGIAAVADGDGGAVLDTFIATSREHVPELHVGIGRLTGNGECLQDARR